MSEAQPTVDETAVGFDSFVRTRRADLWRAAWLLTGDRDKADDLVQTALGRTYGRYTVLANDAKFEAYVRTTIYRTYVSWWRRKWNAELPSDDLPDSPTTSADQAVSMDVVRALAALPKMQRAVMVLRFLEDRTVTEVAELLGIAEGTVKAHTSQGRAALRASLHLSEEERS
ncbi:SigE family RNA polymerase sigma factor [Tessaracoccus lubricantis]|uniref:SigE family RNA polymerase sigma factor n=1 Tax=Tessaracoccus lubricantis TaxID=545543 RepID=A0ABP9F5G0_9ACTN